MRSLIFKLVVPLTSISFFGITKWWYTLPFDAPHTVYTGFPFPYIGDGWHTSLSLQIFVLEFFADLLIYFLIWLVIIFCINRFMTAVKISKAATIFLWAISGIIIAYATFLAVNDNNIFYSQRPYSIKVIDSGMKLCGEQMGNADGNAN